MYVVVLLSQEASSLFVIVVSRYLDVANRYKSFSSFLHSSLIPVRRNFRYGVLSERNVTTGATARNDYSDKLHQQYGMQVPEMNHCTI